MKFIKLLIIILFPFLILSCFYNDKEYIMEGYDIDSWAGKYNDNEYLIIARYHLDHIKKGWYYDLPNRDSLDWNFLFIHVDFNKRTYKILFQKRKMKEFYQILSYMNDGKWLLYNKYEPHYLIYDTNSNEISEDKNINPSDSYLKYINYNYIKSIYGKSSVDKNNIILSFEISKEINGKDQWIEHTMKLPKNILKPSPLHPAYKSKKLPIYDVITFYDLTTDDKSAQP